MTLFKRSGIFIEKVLIVSYYIICALSGCILKEEEREEKMSKRSLLDKDGVQMQKLWPEQTML